MYLSQKVRDADSVAEKKNMIRTIQSGSVVAWQHINLQGEYDFSEEVLKDSIEFELSELLALQVA